LCKEEDIFGEMLSFCDDERRCGVELRERETRAYFNYVG